MRLQKSAKSDMTNGRTFEKSSPGAVWRNLKNEASLKSIGKSFINKRERRLRFVRRWTRRQFYLFNSVDLETGSCIFFHRLWLKREPAFKVYNMVPTCRWRRRSPCQRRAIVTHFEAEVLLFGASIGDGATNELCWQTESQLTAPVTKSFLAAFAAAAAVKLLGRSFQVSHLLIFCLELMSFWVSQQFFSCLTMWPTITTLEPRPKTLTRFPHSGYILQWTVGIQMIIIYYLQVEIPYWLINN